MVVRACSCCGQDTSLVLLLPDRSGCLLLGYSCCSPQIPIAVSGIRGMGFLMKYHIETGGGQLPPRLSSLLIKVSGDSS